MYALSWRTVSALTQVLFWCLFPSLLRNSGNKHQNNPLVSAETVCHSSRYIILFIELNQTLCTSIYHTCNLDSCCHAWKGHIYLIYDKCRFYMINIKCQFGSNTSDVDYPLVSLAQVVSLHMAGSWGSESDLWTVWEITKSSSTFSATNISSNVIWFFQLHDTIKMKSNHTGINYNHNKIAIRSHIMIYKSVYNLTFATKFSSIYLAKGQKCFFFNYHLLTCSVRKMVLICLMQNIVMCLLYKSHQIARLVSHLINHLSKWMFTV